MHTYAEGPTLESESGLHWLSINLPFILWPLLSWTHTHTLTHQWIFSKTLSMTTGQQKKLVVHMRYFTAYKTAVDLTKPVNSGLLFVYSTAVPSGPVKVGHLTGARSAQGSWVPPGITAGRSSLISFSISSAGCLHQPQPPALATLNFINHCVLLHKSVS